MKSYVFDAETNLWCNKILQNIDTITEKHFNQSVNISTDYISDTSIQSLLFNYTYDYNFFSIDLNDISSSTLKNRLMIHRPYLSIYENDSSANIDIQVPSFDSSGSISIDIIPDMEFSYNIYDITYEEYYLLGKLRKYKTDGVVDISDLDFVVLNGNLSKLIYIYLCTEMNQNDNKISDLYEDMSGNLLISLYKKWLIDYFYNRKKITGVELIDTYFQTPNTFTTMLNISAGNLLNNNIELLYSNRPCSKEHLIIYKGYDILICDIDYEYIIDEEKEKCYISWDGKALESVLTLDDKLYIMWGNILQNELLV